MTCDEDRIRATGQRLRGQVAHWCVMDLAGELTAWPAWPCEYLLYVHADSTSDLLDGMRAVERGELPRSAVILPAPPAGWLAEPLRRLPASAPPRPRRRTGRSEPP